MLSLKKLTPAQVEEFSTCGCVFPLAALSGEEVGEYRSRLQDLLERAGPTLDHSGRHKPHLYLRWVSDVVHHPNILDAVEDILGPNLLVWRSVFFIKPAHDPGYLAWHQDSAYWGLSSDAVLTAWIALTDTTIENGCLRVVYGSHRQPELPHTISFGGSNRLVRGQSVAVGIPEERATNVELKAGQFSLHHERLVHGSGCNRSDKIRVGLAIRYIATHVRSRGPRQSAMLVRGLDEYGHFDHEPVPRYDYDPLAVKWHRKTVRRYAAELFWDTLVKPTPRNLLTSCRIIANRKMLRVAIRYLFSWATKRLPRRT